VSGVLLTGCVVGLVLLWSGLLGSVVPVAGVVRVPVWVVGWCGFHVRSSWFRFWFCMYIDRLLSVCFLGGDVWAQVALDLVDGFEPDACCRGEGV